MTPRARVPAVLVSAAAATVVPVISATAGPPSTMTTWYAEDGSTRTVIAGNDLNFTQRGSGHLVGYVGRFLEVAAPDGTATIEMQTPSFADTVFPEVCAALS